MAMGNGVRNVYLRKFMTITGPTGLFWQGSGVAGRETLRGLSQAGIGRAPVGRFGNPGLDFFRSGDTSGFGHRDPRTALQRPAPVTAPDPTQYRPDRHVQYRHVQYRHFHHMSAFLSRRPVPRAGYAFQPYSED